MTKAKGILVSFFLAHLCGYVKCEIGDCQPLLWGNTNKNGLTSNKGTTRLLPSVSSNGIDGRIVIDTSHHGEAGASKAVIVSNLWRICCCVLRRCRGKLMRETTTGFRGGEIRQNGNVDRRDKMQKHLEDMYSDDGYEYSDDEECDDTQQEMDEEMEYDENKETEEEYNDGNDFDMYLKSSRGQLSIGKAAKKLPGLVLGIGAKTTMGIVHTIQPKQVDLDEIAVRWKLEQTIDQEAGAGNRNARHPHTNEKCVATIQLRRDGTVVTRFKGKESVMDYSFWRHRWPRASRIEFNAYAFHGPYDVEPLLKHYKGTFSRNLLDSSIITLSGNIYDIKGKSLWKKYVRSGSFTGVRRPGPKLPISRRKRHIKRRSQPKSRSGNH